MRRRTVLVDDELVAKVMELYGFRTEREAIDYALRRLVGADVDPFAAALALEGVGWEGDLGAMRRGDPIPDL